MNQFLVLSLPRSRSAWLSRFLSYRDWNCGHDQLRYARGLDDVKAWLGMDRTGSCETAGAPFWRLLPRLAPGIRVVTVRRPVESVLASLEALGYPATPQLRRAMVQLDVKLDQVERRLPGVLSVDYRALEQEATCAKVFQYCLPHSHDSAWWRACAGVNVQVNFPAMLQYVNANAGALARLSAQAKQAMLRDLALRPTRVPGFHVREIPFGEFQSTCQDLFRQHCAQVGEHPDNWKNKNIPLMQKLADAGVLRALVGYQDGVPCGYLMTLVAPSLEALGRLTATHTLFFSSPGSPGLGLKLQREATRQLASAGVEEVFLRAGVRGSGDRLDVLYSRLGAAPFGQLFKLDLGA